MRGAEAIRVAFAALQANRLRSLLTMFGVIVGVSAVVVLIGIGTGAQSAVTTQVEGLGSNLLFVVPGKPQVGTAPATSSLRLADATTVAKVVGSPQLVTAEIQSGVQVRNGAAAADVTLVGATETLPGITVRPLLRGDYFTSADVDAGRRVAVLGGTIATTLFGDRDPVGEQVTVSGVRFRVVGVFTVVGSTVGVDRDDEVHVPITTAQQVLGTTRVDALVVKSPTAKGVAALGDRITASLTAAHPGSDFSAISQGQILGTLGTILGLLTTVLAAIAAISLVVAGVGVSNIMLVSVRERTREIGLRKAVGARQRDILAQFLLEAVLLTTTGGLIGIALGVGGYLTISAFVSELPPKIVWWSPTLAFGVSVTVGIVFGVVPARRAGKLDPVVALRTD